MLSQRVSAMSHASIKYAAVADRLQGGESAGIHQRTRRIAYVPQTSMWVNA